MGMYMGRREMCTQRCTRAKTCTQGGLEACVRGTQEKRRCVCMRGEHDVMKGCVHTGVNTGLRGSLHKGMDVCVCTHTGGCTCTHVRVYSGDVGCAWPLMAHFPLQTA